MVPMRNAETLAIVHQFVDIRRKLRIAGMAVLGLHENNNDGVAIACRIFNLADELWTVIERVYPDEDAAEEPGMEDTGAAPKPQRLVGAVFPFRDEGGTSEKAPSDSEE